MGRISGMLKIELMSELCVGSGYSYAGVIDSDVSYDIYGIPFIPARRLKGCMREAARLVCPDMVETLFGRSGNSKSGRMILRNACIDGYDVISEEIKRIQDAGCREASYLSQQNVLKMYTGIRAQTRINAETGTAEENSLRYTRVIRQYDPIKEKETLCFYAGIEFDDGLQEALRRVVKAVRNIGMSRNRGLGSVRCSLIDVMEKTGESLLAGAEGGEEEERVCLTYVLCNREPLMMSGDNAGVSESFIGGKSMVGRVAAAYLSEAGRTASGEEFRKLFLDGTTIFTNAYPTVPLKAGKEAEAGWPDYYPAPFYLNRLKKTKVLVNRLAENRAIPPGMEKAYDMAEGNLPKKLKTHYVYETEKGQFDVMEPEREIIYHNSRKDSLYTLEALKEGQYFKGRIYTNRKYAKLLKSILEREQLSFGKSRTAQYGICELAGNITLEPVRRECIQVEEGEKVAVIFCSDAIFLNESDGYTVKFEEIKKQVGEQLGIPYDRSVDDGSILQTKEVTGYNTTWNLRRPGNPAIKAGSILVYTIANNQRWNLDMQEDCLFAGERNLEGYGQIRVMACKSMSYAVSDLEKPADTCGRTMDLAHCRPILLQILRGQFLDRLIFLYTRKRSGLELSASTVGRLNLMLKESLNGWGENPERAFEDFCSRVNSIKREKEKKEAFRLLRSTVLRDGENTEEYELDLQKMTGNETDARLKEMQELLKQYATEEEYREILVNIWGIYIGNILAYHKYQKKHEGGDGKHAE